MSLSRRTIPQTVSSSKSENRRRKRILVKGASRTVPSGTLCEVIASGIADRLDPGMCAMINLEHDEPFSVCEDFITSETELVSAYHVMKTMKKPNSMSEYEFYLQCAEALGVADVREQTEKMLTLDFIIENEDRHYNNFGLVRNAVTLKWLGVAADLRLCGTSLWYNTVESQIQASSPSLPSKPFRKRTAIKIKLVSDFSWLDFSKARRYRG